MWIDLYRTLPLAKHNQEEAGLRVKDCSGTFGNWGLIGCDLEATLTSLHSGTLLQVRMRIIFQSLYSDMFWYLCVFFHLFPSFKAQSYLISFLWEEMNGWKNRQQHWTEITFLYDSILKHPKISTIEKGQLSSYHLIHFQDHSAFR